VLAFSTISQLGFMVAAVGMGAYVAAMFHLITHAFFKALLFLASGSVIQGMERGLETVHHGHHPPKEEEVFDIQDMRNMGGLQTRMRTTFVVYMAGALALAGIAPLAGFFSKDEILASAQIAFPARFYHLDCCSIFDRFLYGAPGAARFLRPPAHRRSSPFYRKPGRDHRSTDCPGCALGFGRRAQSARHLHFGTLAGAGAGT
jgi:hypothetical protein